MTANASHPFDQTIGHGNATEKRRELVLCPGIKNARFETLNSSLPYFVNAAINVPLPIVTTFANLLVLLAMRHVTSIRLPSKLLLCSLVLTDLGTGLVVQPQFAAFLFIRAIYPGLVQCALFKSLYCTGSLFGCALPLTLAAISLDRYAALFFHVKYQQIVTTRRVCAVLAFIWSLSLLYALALLWKDKVWLAFGLIIAVVYFLVTSVAYLKIYRRLRDQQVQPQAPDQAQQQAGNTLNMERYRRTASAMMWVYVLFLICYVPYSCSAMVALFIGRTSLTVSVSEFSYSLILLNSFLNPFVYCLRLTEFRTEVMKQLRKLCCRSSQQ